MIDLHTHSTFSDGSLTPEELAALARRRGIAAVALTDHDSTGGVARFLAACSRNVTDAGDEATNGIVGISGVELSVEVPRGTLHLLGYYVALGHAALQEALERIRGGRDYRNRLILGKLNALGFALTWEEVAGRAGEDVVGRPHFAQAMQARNFVTSKEEAFDRFLAKGKPAYCDRLRLSPRKAIEILVMAGGVPVLAHPLTLEMGWSELRSCVGELKAFGLQGIEAYYSEHSDAMVSQCLALAQELDLAVAGGSDFHGAANPLIHLGTGFGSLNVPDGLLAKLEARASRRS